MASLTIKNLPPELLEHLRERAAKDRRSLNREVIHLLERALEQGVGAESRARLQVETWRILAGHWSSDLSPDEEAARILSARTPGRETPS